VKSIKKKIIDQNVDNGIWEIPSGYTMNAKPGPIMEISTMKF